MTEAEKWFNLKGEGELLTQVSKAEFADLVQRVLDGELAIDALLLSDRKADRVLGRKLLCVANLCQSPPHLAELLTSNSWRIIRFRKREGGAVDVEVC